MKKTTVYLSEQQMATWEVLVKREGRPKAEILRDALDRYAADSVRRLPAAGIFEDHEVNSTNIDEWLRANWRPD